MEVPISKPDSKEKAGLKGKAKKDRFSYVMVAIAVRNSANRYIEATAYLEGDEVGKISCADNYLPGVISSPCQTMTIPVPPDKMWEVKWNIANNNGEITITTIE